MQQHAQTLEMQSYALQKRKPHSHCISLHLTHSRCISRPRRAQPPQRVARAKTKSHSRLHFAHSTRAISAEGWVLVLSCFPGASLVLRRLSKWSFPASLVPPRLSNWSFPASTSSHSHIFTSRSSLLSLLRPGAGAPQNAQACRDRPIAHLLN